jgi:O-antigen ligase
LIIGAQLIPIPPQIWEALPGRSSYAEALQIAGIPHSWRPMSLTPDLTLNSLLSLLPPLALVLSAGLIDRSDQKLIIPLIIIAVVVSAVIGLVQISSGSLYFYRVTNLGSPVGVFANRNHQALFLAATLPLLAGWAVMPHRDQAYRKLRMWVALCVAASILPLLMVTGSRAGLIAGLIGGLLAIVLVFKAQRLSPRDRPRRKLQAGLLLALPLAFGTAALVGTYMLSRDEALQRLFADQGPGIRSTFIPLYREMAWDFAPFGSGYGSFDTVFRVYEPADQLRLTYLNHAHNDLAQIAIEGGILPLLVLSAFLLWLVTGTWRIWSARLDSTDRVLGHVGSAVAFLILAGSLVDYPLRTPWMAVLMVLACHWVRLGASRSPERG